MPLNSLNVQIVQPGSVQVQVDWGEHRLPPPWPPLTSSPLHDPMAPLKNVRLFVVLQMPAPVAILSSYPAGSLSRPVPFTLGAPLEPGVPATPGPPRPAWMTLLRIARLAFDPET